MRKWRCTTCGYIYDEKAGLPEHGIPAGTPFEELPDNWECPDCGAAKGEFVMVQK